MMTQLRQRMLEELQRRNYSSPTIRLYLRHVAKFAQHFHRSPDQLRARYSSVSTVPDSGKEAGVVQLQPDRLCTALLLCQGFEACVPVTGDSFPPKGAEAPSDPQSGGSGTNPHCTSASQKPCLVDDHLCGRFAAFRGGQFASARHRFGAHDHHRTPRQRAEGSRGDVIPGFARDVAAVLATP